MPAAAALLQPWATFYQVLGSAGAALVGIQFVVITLIANIRRHVDPATIHAFATPTVTHFAAVVALSALMAAPWSSVHAAALVVGAFGTWGLVYGVVVAIRARHQTEYQPVLSDWIWYASVPAAAYAAIIASALRLSSGSERAPYVIAAAALTLLMAGIHNAWDTVTHIVTVGSDAGPGQRTPVLASASETREGSAGS